jgi:predicted nucleic acid-binding protein
MSEIFADTSGWANYFVRSEPFHSQARQLMQQWFLESTRIITTNYVLAELVALMTSPLRVPRSEQIQVVETIKTAKWVEVVHIHPQLDQEAWQLLKARSDKLWSLADCASFVVMGERKITSAFTSDHHFEQAGFVVELKKR